MAGASSVDPRRKLLETHQDREGTAEELAQQFRASAPWARKIHRSGKMERPPGKQRGRQSKVTIEVEDFCKAAVAKHWDVTLAELRLRPLQ